MVGKRDNVARRVASHAEGLEQRGGRRVQQVQRFRTELRVRGEGALEVDLARARELGSQGGERCAAVGLCPGRGRGRGAFDEEGEGAGIGAGERELDPAWGESEGCGGGWGERDEGPEGFAVDCDRAPAPADLRDGYACGPSLWCGWL